MPAVGLIGCCSPCFLPRCGYGNGMVRGELLNTAVAKPSTNCKWCKAKSPRTRAEWYVGRTRQHVAHFTHKEGYCEDQNDHPVNAHRS